MTTPIPQITIADDKPVIAGTTITIEQILTALANGTSHETLLTQFPGMTEADIQAAFRYAISAVQHADPTLILHAEDDDELSIEEIEANFKQGWREAMRGEGISLEELWASLDADNPTEVACEE
jgi:uncharacterized protein (DUF433 family)